MLRSVRQREGSVGNNSVDIIGKHGESKIFTITIDQSILRFVIGYLNLLKILDMPIDCQI